jgi:hypothetical protein
MRARVNDIGVRLLALLVLLVAAFFLLKLVVGFVIGLASTLLFVVLAIAVVVAFVKLTR